jgi:hypothetical protein
MAAASALPTSSASGAAKAAPSAQPPRPRSGGPSGAGGVRAARRGGIPRFGDGRDWFFERRFGLFVHWGIYAIPGWHEQHQWRARAPRAEYVKLAREWNPTKFKPDAWLDLMEEAGMKYICITTKHHEGFCLWDTKQTSFNTMNTPYQRDIIGMLAILATDGGYRCASFPSPTGTT